MRKKRPADHEEFKELLKDPKLFYKVDTICDNCGDLTKGEKIPIGILANVWINMQPCSKCGCSNLRRN